MKSVLVVVAILTLSASAFAKPAKKRTHGKPAVTVINLDGPSAPDSPWPTVAQKGHL